MFEFLSRFKTYVYRYRNRVLWIDYVKLELLALRILLFLTSRAVFKNNKSFV